MEWRLFAVYAARRAQALSGVPKRARQPDDDVCDDATDDVIERTPSEYTFASADALQRVLAPLAVYGNVASGAELRVSTIANAGLGVFATRTFERGDFITTYDGDVVSHSAAMAAADTTAASHYRALFAMRWTIAGLRVPTNGRGLGSFVNDTIDMNATKRAMRSIRTQPTNALFERLDNAQYNVFSNIPPRLGFDVAIVITARCHIPIGAEIFVAYGDDYWKRTL